MYRSYSGHRRLTEGRFSTVTTVLILLANHGVPTHSAHSPSTGGMRARRAETQSPAGGRQCFLGYGKGATTSRAVVSRNRTLFHRLSVIQAVGILPDFALWRYAKELGAFPPATFAPNALRPRAFRPRAFRPRRFPPSRFSPPRFSPPRFSPLTLFAPALFAPALFAPDVFRPRASRPRAFAPRALRARPFRPRAFRPIAKTWGNAKRNQQQTKPPQPRGRQHQHKKRHAQTRANETAERTVRSQQTESPSGPRRGQFLGA